MVRYPQPGCLVEYLEGNALQIAIVLEGDENRLRLLLPNRREAKLSTNRILPWIGPCFNLSQGREEAIRILGEHKAKREEIAKSAPLIEAWEMAQGEIDEAPASWFAELFDSDPDEDTIAGFGRALLDFKSHFRFQPPQFQVFGEETVQKRLYEEKIKNEREALIDGGASFLKQLWTIAQKHENPPPKESWPGEAACQKIRELLFDRLVDPESQKDETTWNLLFKGMPDVPHLPLQLLTAWGLLPPHYNFWLERADFARGDDWWQASRDEVEKLADAAKAADLPMNELPFVSIDSAKTQDIDDAFHVAETENGFELTIALACPALMWNFGDNLDKMVRKRATSIYLPEGDLHMLPECLGLNTYSLVAGKTRAALCIAMHIDADGQISSASPSFARVCLAANLNYRDAEDVLAGRASESNPAAKYSGLLNIGHRLASLRKRKRIEDGAVIMDRQDPRIVLEGDGWDTHVLLEEEEATPHSQNLVSEMMISASAAIADWAAQHGLPLLHRTQDVAVPREYAGEWSRPADMAKVMRALIPSTLEITGKRHAALAVARYAPITSPLRRYSDLVNESQILHFLENATPLFDEEGMENILGQLSPALENAGHAQKFRPRYWKLLYIAQQGPKFLWNGVITEENEMAVTVNLPKEGLFVRGKRKLFDERACPGMAVKIRLGKVNPLYNEIQIMEAQPID